LKKLPVVLVTLLLLSSCGINPFQFDDPYNLDWVYQEDERRLNFKNTAVLNENGRKIIRGTVENVGDDPWSQPTIHFDLLDRNMNVIDTVSLRRFDRLSVGQTWEYTVRPQTVTNFYRARFREPTGW